MARLIKISLSVLGGLLLLIGVVALVLLFFVDLDNYRPRLESAATEALGLEVKVAGRLGIGFFPGLHFELGDLRIRNRGTDLLSAKAAELGIDLLPLFRQKLHIGKVVLRQPKIFIERDLEGKFNFENSGGRKGAMPAFDLAGIYLLDGTCIYADKISKRNFTVSGCRLALRRLHISGGNGAELMKDLSFTVDLICSEIRVGGFAALTDLKLSAVAKKGVVDVQPVSMRLFGGQGSGSGRVEFAGGAPNYRINYSLSKFRLEEFFKALTPDKVAAGVMDFSVNLSLPRNSEGKPTSGAEGELSLRGKNLKLYNVDLDQNISRFESSQNFNLVDVGAIFLAGPLGVLVTKGYNFASLVQGGGGLSEIRILTSNWKLGRGVALAQDVAMATKKNRVALRGEIDFTNQRFNDLQLAVVDGKGCAVLIQKVHGSFQKPLLDKPGVVKSLAGPLLNLFKEGINHMPGGECEVFYSGSVVAPR